MSYYLLHTPAGDIVRWGHNSDPAAQAEAGLTVLEITAEQHRSIDPMLQRVTDGQLVARETGERDTAPAWAQVRARRNALLTASDWVRLRAADLGEPVPAEWITYRQALRDVTDQADPFAITWPAPPSG